jgi:cytochrome c peroxidase
MKGLCWLIAVMALVGPSLAGQARGQMHGMMGMMHGGIFAPLPESVPSPQNALTEDKVLLGRMLFFDPRLSRERDVSCNTCHDLNKYGVDGARVSTGHAGQTGTRNAPTVFNAAAHVVQFWDGRAPDVEEQAKGPVLNPVEMAMQSPEETEKVLRSIPGYVAAFRKAFPDSPQPVTFDNMAKAIAAFERKLMTPSRWDRFLKGDRSAITSTEWMGYMTFHHAGCAQCHNGPTVGATTLQQLGRAKPWPDQSDPGRYAVTGQEQDRMFFKVPSLRNVAMTAPYFHNGSVSTLEDAVLRMGEYQVGFQLTPPQVESIIAWLQTLTGELPEELIAAPALPPEPQQWR